MATRISRKILDSILAEAAATPDREVCGLLFGGEGGPIEAAQAAANVAADPADSFEIDPAVLFKVIRAERMSGPRVAGHYHSHPSGSAEPSARDAAMAHQPGRLWLIVAEGRALLWQEAPGGGMQGAFEPVRLVVDRGNGGCA